MGKALSGLMAIFMAVEMMLSGCGSTGAETEAKDNGLYEQGTEVVALMSEMALNDGYVKLFTGSGDIAEKLKGAGAAEPSNPKAVYELKLEADVMYILGVSEIGEMSDDLRALITAKSYSAVANQINAMGGAETLAASSICTASKSFVNSQFTGNTIYIYLYEDSVPVMIAFSSNGEGVVTATGSFILYDIFDGKTPASKEDIEGIFKDFPIELVEIKK